MPGVVLDKYLGRYVEKDINKVSDSVQYPVADKVTERVHNNLKENRDRRLI